MQTTTMCKAEHFCESCKEQGGEFGAPLQYWCFEQVCQYPGKLCMYVQAGGKRPQDGE